jgi:FdhE protein
MTPSVDTNLQKISRDYPEWKPWLAVIEEVLKEAADPKWNAVVPADARPKEKTPLLAGARIAFEVGSVRRWVMRLIRTAHTSGTSEMATLKPAESADLDIPALFQASLCQDSKKLQTIALDIGADAGAFRAVAELVPIPFLQACARRCAPSAAESWTEGYCLICGAWPAFAEVRGIERSRYLRCSRCGGEWQFRLLHCPYCGVTEHTELTSLVPENGGPTRTVEACRRCLGYIKNFTTLQGTPGNEVILKDLASVDLDVAAAEQGYRRAEGPGYRFDVTIVHQ